MLGLNFKKSFHFIHLPAKPKGWVWLLVFIFCAVVIFLPSPQTEVSEAPVKLVLPHDIPGIRLSYSAASSLSYEITDPEQIEKVYACFDNLVLKPSFCDVDSEHEIYVDFIDQGMGLSVDPNGVFGLSRAITQKVPENPFEDNAPNYEIVSGTVDFDSLKQIVDTCEDTYEN